jgi:hypothetical protein
MVKEQKTNKRSSTGLEEFFVLSFAGGHKMPLLPLTFIIHSNKTTVMKKIKVFLLLTIIGLLSFNFANAQISITRGTSAPNPLSVSALVTVNNNSIPITYSESHTFAIDGTTNTYTGNGGFGTQYIININLEGVNKSASLATVAGNSPYALPLYDFPTYSYRVIIYNLGGNNFRFEIIKFTKIQF